MMNRRLFLTGLAGATAGLVVAQQIPEAARRYWALDRTMAQPEPEWTPMMIGSKLVYWIDVPPFEPVIEQTLVLSEFEGVIDPRRPFDD